MKMIDKIPIEANALHVDEMISGGVWRCIPYINQTQLFNAIRKNDNEERPVVAWPPSRANNCGKSAMAEMTLFTSAK